MPLARILLFGTSFYLFSQFETTNVSEIGNPTMSTFTTALTLNLCDSMRFCNESKIGALGAFTRRLYSLRFGRGNLGERRVVSSYGPDGRATRHSAGDGNTAFVIEHGGARFE